MVVYFISDLHLRAREDRVARLLVKFLSEIPKNDDIVILGGDLFDLFVGNKSAFANRFTEVLNAINALAERGTRVYYAEGNHDFHLTGVFSPKVVIAEDSFAVNCSGLSAWVAHGDRIDPEDHGYHFLRFLTRTAFVRALVWLLPNAWLSALGIWSSRQSRKYNSTERLSADRVERTKRIFRDYADSKLREGYRWVFLGHSHLADRLDTEKGSYINLGFSSDALLYARGNPLTGSVDACRYQG